MIVEARDGDQPPRSTRTDVTVTVARNLHAPELQRPGSPEYRDEISVKETTGFNTVLYAFDGDDQDSRVSSLMPFCAFVCQNHIS